jgi:hypothetical protein
MKLFFRFFKSWIITRYAKWGGYEILASPDVQHFRNRYCQRCPHFRDGECTVCGCLVMAKIMLNTEECPKKYWQRAWKRRVTTIR